MKKNCDTWINRIDRNTDIGSIRANKDIEVTALAAGSNIDLLEKQIREFSPKIAAVWNEEKAKELKDRVRDLDIRVESGMDGLLAVATELGAEIVVTAVVGMIGIRPTIAAMNAGKDIALAKQRDPGNGRAYHYVAGKGEACPHSAGGQRA